MAIKKRTVNCGLKLTTFENTHYLGLDGKSLWRNERVITVLSDDIHGERVLVVDRHKSMTFAKTMLLVLPDATCANIDAVVMDTEAAAYAATSAALLPNTLTRPVSHRTSVDRRE